MGKHKKAPLPEDYPEEPRSAYAIFCKEFGARRREEAAHGTLVAAEKAPGGAGPAAAAAPEEPPPGGKRSFLKDLSTAWRALEPADRERYQRRAAVDAERFQTMLAAWLAKQPDGGIPLPPEAQAAGRRGLPRARVPREFIVRPPTEMGNLLHSAYMHGIDKTNERKQKRSDDAGAADGSLTAGQSRHDRAYLDGGPAGAPVPLGPRQHEPSVDDLLGDLMAVESPQQSAGSGGYDNDNNDYRGAGALVHHGAPPGSAFDGLDDDFDFPEASGAPKVLGPQLTLDEHGNIVLNKSSLSRGSDGVPSNFEHAAATTEESVTQYEEAYKSSPRVQWTEEETDFFYEAMRLYGTDLFLVQTFFRNKSAAQIKQKYTKEVKKNPEKLTRALTTEARKLTRDTFERLHWKIDTSKHFNPPASPVPGEVPEVDGSLPTGSQGAPVEEEDELLPPEPEFSAEDESHTTNRLMALFD